jgi:hypothetical protein
MNLKTYLRLGLKLTKVHRVLSFTQSNFLGYYIDRCTELRVQSETDFGKRLWKLFANAVFGKFIERTRDYLNVKMCREAEVCSRTISSPRFSNMKIISEGFVAIFLKQSTVFLNKAFPIGFTILERSKDFMYQQFYEVIRPALSDCDVQVLFSDTDSFGISIKSSEINVDHFDRLSNIFDFSNYPPTAKQYSKKHASKLGYWKDEIQGQRMLEFVGLRSKTYAFLIGEEGEEKNATLKSKCKGVTKGYKKTIPFQKFKRCIEKFSKVVLQQYHIRASNHIVKTLKVQKTCFSSFDDKRYLLCAIHSVPYGSKLIKSNCFFCQRK